MTIVPAKIPMAEAVSTLAILCDSIDDCQDIDTLILQTFNETKLQLQDSIDRRITFFNALKGLKLAAQEAREGWAVRYRQLSTIETRLKQYTVDIMKEYRDLPYSGKLGRLALQRSPAKLKLSFATYDEHLSNLIAAPDLHRNFVPKKYIDKQSFFILKKEVIKADLKAGVKLPWAKLQIDEHLRIRKS